MLTPIPFASLSSPPVESSPFEMTDAEFGFAVLVDQYAKVWLPQWWTQRVEGENEWADFDCGPLTFDEATRYLRGFYSEFQQVPFRLCNIRRGRTRWWSAPGLARPT